MSSGCLPEDLKMQHKTETDGEQDAWISEQARADDDDDDDDDDIVAMYNITACI